MHQNMVNDLAEATKALDGKMKFGLGHVGQMCFFMRCCVLIKHCVEMVFGSGSQSVDAKPVPLEFLEECDRRTGGMSVPSRAEFAEQQVFQTTSLLCLCLGWTLRAASVVTNEWRFV